MSERLAAIERALEAYRMDEARALARAELDENPSAAAYTLAARAALSQGERLQYLRDALKLEPEYAPAIAELNNLTLQAPDEAPATQKPKRESPPPVVERAPPPLRLASIGKRWLAIVIDGFIVAVLSVALLVLGGAMAPLDAALASGDQVAVADGFNQFQSTTLTVNLLVSAVYNAVLMTRLNGRTLGKMALKLRVVKKKGGRITLLDALLRNVFGYMISQIFMLGYLWALFDREKQAWHDKMAGTVVIDQSPRGKAASPSD